MTHFKKYWWIYVLGLIAIVMIFRKQIFGYFSTSASTNGSESGRLRQCDCGGGISTPCGSLRSCKWCCENHGSI